MSSNYIDVSAYSAMQTGTPYKTYKKTILGRVEVKILDPFVKDKEAVALLKGDPARNEESCFVDVWTPQEDMYIQKRNQNHIKTGVLIPYDRAAQPVESTINPYNVLTDDELYDLLNSPYFKLEAAMNKMDSTAPVFRLLYIAKKEEKSEKIIKAIEGRLAELQDSEFAVEKE